MRVGARDHQRADCGRMIVEFEVMMIWPGVYLLTATMVDAPSVQLGIFGSVEDIDEACEQFLAEHQRQVH
jgi:hypothetical protein